MNKKDIQWFINTVKTSRIDGYAGDVPPSDEPCGSVKTKWLSIGRSLMKQLAKALNLPAGSFEVRVNKAGPAVSGDIHLHGEWIYVALEQGFNANEHFMWRYCDGQHDYTGRANQWARWEDLLDLPALAARMQQYRPTPRPICDECLKPFKPSSPDMTTCDRCSMAGAD